MNRKSALHYSCKTVLQYGIFLFWPYIVNGQTYSGTGDFNLKTMLDIVEKNYPSISAKKAEADAAKTSVSLEKNTLLPSLDASYQLNYATYNNITGMSYPGQMLPISGPPSTDNFNNPVPGTGASLQLNWSPITFGQHDAMVDYNLKMYEKQLAAVEDEGLKIKYHAAFLYLEIAATNELIKAYKKNIERNEFNLMQISTLVNSGLRPTVDSVKFSGERSKSLIELYKIQHLRESRIHQLQELLVTEDLPDFIADSLFFENLPFDPAGQDKSDSIMNPALKMARFSMEAEQARLKQINRSWVPRVNFWGTVYARGSGIRYDGYVNKSDGLTFSRYNYGSGVQLIFPVIDLSNVKIKSNRQKFIAQSTESYLHQTEIAVRRQEKTARSELTTALKVAEEAPVEYRANESAFFAIRSRYNEGLTDYADLIQAQYDLLNAEFSLKNAYLDAWKALLRLAVVKGDINIFLNQIPN